MKPIEFEVIEAVSQNIKEADLPSDELRWLAQEIGVPAVLKVIWFFSGINFYIPINAKKMLKKEYIKKHFNGNNIRELAVRLDISEATVQNWVSESPVLQHNFLDELDQSRREKAGIPPVIPTKTGG